MFFSYYYHLDRSWSFVEPVSQWRLARLGKGTQFLRSIVVVHRGVAGFAGSPIVNSINLPFIRYMGTRDYIGKVFI